MRPQRGEISLANRGGNFLAAARLNSTRSTRRWSSQKGRRPCSLIAPHRYAVFGLDKQALEVNLVLSTRQARRSWPCD